ncbi:MAG: hypothetical protein QOI87_2724 [Bradyrhizobium sp.]|jgi:hypothetical protein|nr:hypothetical protein [Bradyrhizobium sp.]
MAEYEEFRVKERRRSFATAELPDEKVQAIGASRMDERHAYLDAVLHTDEKGMPITGREGTVTNTQSS